MPRSRKLLTLAYPPAPPLPQTRCSVNILLASLAETEPSGETSEEEAERVLAAIDAGLVEFSGDKDGVPYYRLHRVVAKAITRKKYIIVSETLTRGGGRQIEYSQYLRRWGGGHASFI